MVTDASFWIRCCSLSRMEDQDRVSQASSSATVSFLPIRDKVNHIHTCTNTHDDIFQTHWYSLFDYIRAVSWKSADVWKEMSSGEERPQLSCGDQRMAVQEGNEQSTILTISVIINLWQHHQIIKNNDKKYFTNFCFKSFNLLYFKYQVLLCNLCTDVYFILWKTFAQFFECFDIMTCKCKYNITFFTYSQVKCILESV